MQVLKNMMFRACLEYQLSFHHWSACERALVTAIVLGDTPLLLAENIGVKLHKLKALNNCPRNIRPTAASGGKIQSKTKDDSYGQQGK